MRLIFFFSHEPFLIVIKAGTWPLQTRHHPCLESEEQLPSLTYFSTTFPCTGHCSGNRSQFPRIYHSGCIAVVKALFIPSLVFRRDRSEEIALNVLVCHRNRHLSITMSLQLRLQGLCRFPFQGRSASRRIPLSFGSHRRFTFALDW